MFVCQFCNNSFKTSSSLGHHQRTAKYCLRNQGVANKNLVCEFCNKSYSSKFNLSVHHATCTEKTIEDRTRDYVNTIESLRKQLSEKDQQIKDLQNKLENVAIRAVSRPTTTKNTQINNYIQKLECITDEHIQDQAQFLTIDHIQRGPEGYAEYALEYPLKNRIVCVDYARRKVKFKDKEGNIITDPEMSSIATKLFQSIKDRNKDLILSYGTELRDRFGDEMDTVVKLLEYKSNVDNSADGSKPEFLHDFVRSVCGKTIPE